jgi:type III secretion system low calcium response chaperone LcrH/SycD
MRQTGLSLREMLSLSSINTNHRALKHFFNEGGTFQDLYGMSDLEMERRYDHAMELLTQKEYGQAEMLLHYLATLNPYRKKYWLGLGMSQLHGGDHLTSIESYSMASLLDPSDPAPYFFSSYCYLALGKGEEALRSLQMALEAAKRDPSFRQMETKAASLIKSLSATEKKTPKERRKRPGG